MDDNFSTAREGIDFDRIEPFDEQDGQSHQNYDLLQKAIQKMQTGDEGNENGRRCSTASGPSQRPRVDSHHSTTIPPRAEDMDEQRDLRDRLDVAPLPDREFAWPHPIQEDEVRIALKKEASKHSLWKTSAAKKMKIIDIECSTALHYSLETFTESRSSFQATESCSVGQYIESIKSGGALCDPWDIDCPPSAEFMEEQRIVDLPGSSEILACQSCGAEGSTHCFHCRGFGTDRCSYCRGTGMKAGIPHPAVVTHPMVATYPHSDLSRGYPGSGIATMRPNGPHHSAYAMGTPVHFLSKTGIPPPGVGSYDLCHFCLGRGVKQCHHCRGAGKKSCTVCGGTGSVKQITKLKVKFEIECSEYTHPSVIPENLLKNVTGEILLAESDNLVMPLRNYPVEELNSQSKRLLQIHLSKLLGTCKIIQQRHVLEAIPIAKVQYELAGKNGIFWVYGQERLCYVAKYPAKCSIL